jgi:hypothetical protein
VVASWAVIGQEESQGGLGVDERNQKLGCEWPRGIARWAVSGRGESQNTNLARITPIRSCAISHNQRLRIRPIRGPGIQKKSKPAPVFVKFQNILRGSSVGNYYTSR